MEITKKINTGDEELVIRTISTSPKEHFEGRWKAGRLYPLFSVVVNNGTTFVSQNAKMKEEPYVLYDAVAKEFKANDGWKIKAMSADSRLTALGGGSEGGVTPGEVEEMIAGKQDVIPDLSEIRSGASSGANAYQKPSAGIPKNDLSEQVKASLDNADLVTGKQDIIPDLQTIRTDAAAGATAVQPEDLNSKQDVISDLSTIRSGAAAGATSVQPAEFNELKDEVDTIGNGAYEEAWDGDSTPVVSDIPAGVVVTYSSDSYTGTLAASASTVDKIYLVSDGNGNYDRYTTVEANGAYSWKKVGSTAIPLSNYATKTKVNQLAGEFVTNPDWIRAITDEGGRILFGIKPDGTIEWGVGVPTPVQDFVTELLTEKVDKVTGKSLIDSVIADMQAFESNPEFVHAITDSESKILEAIKADGTKYFTSGVELANLAEVRGENEQEWIKVLLDGEGKAIWGIKTNGELWWADGVPQCVKDYVNEQKEDALNFPYKKYFPLMQSLKRNKINRSTGLPYTTYNTLSLAVLSDIHSETDSLKRFLSFVTKYANFIDDSIILGDVAANQWNDYVTAWDSLIGYNRVLQVIGNHDVYNPDNEATDAGHPYYDPDYWASEARCRARYMAGIDTWGVVGPANASYYYKDYANANIRLIVIDSLHWNTAQKDWFANVLYGENNADSAIALGRQVVVASHIAAGTQGSDFGFFDCNFTGKDGTMNDWWENHDWREYVDIFQTTKGGTFICYLYGHTHTDFVGNYTDYPNQTFIIFPTGSPTRYFADTVSSKDSEFIDQFTIFSVEPESKMIRLFRIGANYSRHLVHRESIMIRYENGHREVVSQY